MFPTLAVVVIIGFSLNQCAPGDPVRQYLGISMEDPSTEDEKLSQNDYRKTRAILGLDKPIFYFNLNALSQSDTLYKIDDQMERESLEAITDQYGNWEQVQAHHQAWKKLKTILQRIDFPTSLFDLKTELRSTATRNLFETDLTLVPQQLDTIEAHMRPHSALLGEAIAQVPIIRDKHHDVIDRATKWKSWVPTLNWYGADNQFHHWLMGALKFDFGKSYANRQSVSGRIIDRLPKTILLSVLATFFALLISIPLGVFSARRLGTKWDRGITLGVFLLYSLPTFWVGILLMSYFANPEHFAWFPPTNIRSIDYAENWSFLKKFLDIAHHLVLPTIVYTYSSLAYITRQMRGSMLNTFQEDYIRTAFAKGLSEKRVAWHHAFRNSLSPIITMMAGILPGLVGGAIIIEVIFVIPGMGTLMIDSIYAKDFPTLSAIFLLLGVMTILGILLSDILLVLSDPRIKLARK